MKLRNFLFEQVEDESINVETSYPEDTSYSEVSEDVNTDGVTQDGFIQDIYDKNDLSDTARSIFKVEELVNSLPKEMPTETKKNTVSSIMASFGLTVEEITNDALKRAEIIKNALQTVTEENNSAIDNNEASIEQKKIEIGDLEKDNAERKEFISDITDKVDAELTRLNNLLEFIC